MAVARFEPTAGILRVWCDDANCNYGDPYEWCCTVSYQWRDEVELMGYLDRVTVPIWRAIYKEMQRLGVSKVHTTRYKNGRTVRKIIPIKSVSQEMQDKVERDNGSV